MTDYVVRVTMCSPRSLVEQAKYLALIFGEREDDLETFTSFNFEDDSGVQYSVASMVGKIDLPGKLVGEPSVPDWIPTERGARSIPDIPKDTGLIISQIKSAQGVLDLWEPVWDEANETWVVGPQAAPDRITAVIHENTSRVISWLGLNRIK